MRILSFEFHDDDGWTLEPTKLDAFNLLVGLSGAGKTRIVRAIERVCEVALGTNEAWPALGTTFTIEFEHDGLTYRWEAEQEGLLIAKERIHKGGQPLVVRTPGQFMFDGRELPPLDRARSAIATLKEDRAMTPVHVAFSRCVFQALNVMPSYGAKGAPVDEQRQRYPSVEALGADFSLPLHNKAELLAGLFPEAFAEIEAAFREAFPLVQRLVVGTMLVRQPHVPGTEMFYRAHPYLSAQESGIEGPVDFRSMSSGMQRYLSFLVHLSFAPHGTVVLIDELESSFGINCLPAATRFLLRRAPDLQLILTSHHPYIIDKVPTELWKIVTRKGGHVRILDAATIPALEESRSHLDRFTRLINLPEYEQGIQA